MPTVRPWLAMLLGVRSTEANTCAGGAQGSGRPLTRTGQDVLDTDSRPKWKYGPGVQSPVIIVFPRLLWKARPRKKQVEHNRWGKILYTNR